MMEQEIIEKLRNQKCKLERDLKAKTDVIADLSAENDSVITELEKIKEKYQVKEKTNEILETKYKNARENLKEMNEEFEKVLKVKDDQINKLSLELSNLLSINEKLSARVDSLNKLPQIDVKKIEKKFEDQIANLNDVIDQLQDVIRVHKQREKEMESALKHEKEVSLANSDRLKAELGESINKIEQMQFTFIEMQSQRDQANFAKQGNTLYAEVDDRRVLAESKLKEIQERLEKQSQINLNLRVYLQESFKAYSGLVEESYTQKRTELERELSRLRQENTALSVLQQELVDQTKKKSGESSEASLRLENTILQHKLKKAEKDVSKMEAGLDVVVKEKKKFFNDLKQQTEKLIEVERKKSVTSIQLDILKTLVSVDVIKTFDEEIVKLEQSQKQNENDTKLFISSENELAFPNINKDSNKLVFDVYGNVVGNKLTDRICKNLTERNAAQISKSTDIDPVNEKKSPLKGTCIDEHKQSQCEAATNDNDKSESKENQEPRNLFSEVQTSFKLQDEAGDCRVS